MISRRAFLSGTATLAGAHALRALPRHPGPLVPSAPSHNAGYYCTWHAQYYIASTKLAAEQRAITMMGPKGSALSRAEMNGANLFSPLGLAKTLYPTLRHDLFFVLDDGWDVPPNGDLSNVGSLEIDTHRFPQFTGNPLERTIALNHRLRADGWRGAGLWISAQPAPAIVKRETAAGKDTTTEAWLHNYFRERLEWSHAAGIGYWKVDWGKSSGDVNFRTMLSDLARKFAPGLVVENTIPTGPLNQPLGPAAPGQTAGRVDPDWVRRGTPLLALPGTFRIYDSIPFLSAPTLIDRTAALLQAAKPGDAATLNSEDELYLGAVLGCNFGIMRHSLDILDIPPVPNIVDIAPRHLARRLVEAERAVRWQRIAPPVPVGTGTVTLDDQTLSDTWRFSPGETWMLAVIGKEIEQSAPARVTRNLPLPQVTGADTQPFVVAAKHPNGALAVATIGRTSPNGWSEPLAEVTIDGGDLHQKIGIFGRYQKLSINFSQPLAGHLVFAQDLAANRAENITSRCTLQEKTLHLDGNLIDQLCATEAARLDGSDPGLVLTVI